MLRMFHYVVGITAPDKKHEKFVLFLWIGLFIAFLIAGLLFTFFIVPHIINQK